MIVSPNHIPKTWQTIQANDRVWFNGWCRAQFAKAYKDWRNHAKIRWSRHNSITCIRPPQAQVSWEYTREFSVAARLDKPCKDSCGNLQQSHQTGLMFRGFDDHELRHGEDWNHAKQQTTQVITPNWTNVSRLWRSWTPTRRILKPCQATDYPSFSQVWKWSTVSTFWTPAHPKRLKPSNASTFRVDAFDIWAKLD